MLPMMHLSEVAAHRQAAWDCCRLSNIVESPEVVYIEALVFSADTVEMRVLRRLSDALPFSKAQYFAAPRIDSDRAIYAWWSIIKSLHVVLQIPSSRVGLLPGQMHCLGPSEAMPYFRPVSFARD